MSSELTLPPILRRPGLESLIDVPVSCIDRELRVFEAYFEGELGHIDMHGRRFRRGHGFAGMGRTPHEARMRCFMEAVERASGTDGTVMREHAHLGAPDVRWSEFFPYIPEEVAEVDEARLGWPEYSTHAVGLHTGRRYSVPCEAVFPWWRSFFATSLPRPECDGNGIAAGWQDDPSTIHRALCELLERDALILSWRAPGWPTRPLPLPAMLDERLLRWIRGQELTLELYDIGDPGLAPVALAVLSEGPHATVGASCQPWDLPAACEKATLETIMLRRSARGLSADWGELPEHAVGDSYAHVVWAWRHGELVREWYRNGRGDVPPARPDSVVAACRDRFEHEPLLVDLTADWARELGAWVVRVIQPGAYRKEYRHDLRYRGGERLRALGLTPRELNPHPHPIG